MRRDVDPLRAGDADGIVVDVDRAAVAELARKVLPALLTSAPDAYTQLIPGAELYAQVFRHQLAAAAMAAHHERWHPGATLEKPRAGAAAMVITTTAESFAVIGDPVAAQFPGGYRRIASELQPGVVWSVVRFVVPGERTGLVFDGFAYLEGTGFAWFPKPYLLVRAARPEVYHDG